MSKDITVMRGFFGWSNRANGEEAYGPGGRWGDDGLGTEHGDLLADALRREGQSEGAELVVIAIPRFPNVLEEHPTGMRSQVAAEEIVALVDEYIGQVTFEEKP